MKTLSVKAWWAWAIIRGQKRIENRYRPTHYRGPLAIHASQSRCGLAEARIKFPELPDADQLIFGAVIGVVTLIDCIAFEDFEETEVHPQRYASGPWCWLLSAPRALPKPILCAGRLSFFETPTAEPIA
jgi:hypothetical protein